MAGRAEAGELEIWERQALVPLVQRMAERTEMRVLTWEACIDRVVREEARWGAELRAFYERAMELASLQPAAGEVAP